MVRVKVRETYDLHTTKNKMTVIGIHTPGPTILKRNFPGLLMQCKAYRPVKADVVVACASVLPLDPQGVGLTENDVAPEDVFNPILYKAMSNFGMSQLEARINKMVSESGNNDVQGDTAFADVDNVVPANVDQFNLYYGLLSNARGWKTASPQRGLVMRNLRPLVWDMVYNIGDNRGAGGVDEQYGGITNTAAASAVNVQGVRGRARKMPFINCLAYDAVTTLPGFPNPDADHGDYLPYNAESTIPNLRVMVAGLVIPPSRLHELFFRMTVTWEIEFSMVRPIGEITDINGGLPGLGARTHFQNYDYSQSKKDLTGTSDSILEQDTDMVASNVDITKVM